MVEVTREEYRAERQRRLFCLSIPFQNLVALSFPRLPVIRRLGQGKEHNLLSSHGADVVVQAQHLDASNIVDHGFQVRPPRLDQVGPYLFEQVPSFLLRERLDQVLFGGGQDTLEADHEEAADQVGADVFGTAAHVFLLEAAHSFADGGFDLALGFHRDDPKKHPWVTPGRQGR